MSPREKKLAAFVGIALVLWFANSGLTRYRGALDRASNAHLAAATELAEAETAVFRGQRAQSRLNRWRRQSLPTDQDVAESLYQDWLKQSLQKSGLEIKSLRDTSTMRRTDEHSHIEVLVEVAGSLQQLTQFLQNFYASNHLHRISKATLAPTEDRRQVNATLNIDGLILPKCPRTDQLAEGAGPLDAQALGDAVKSINARNLFAVYEPNQRTANGNEREFTGRDMWAKNSEAAETKLTSIYQGSYGPLA
ncbi:MAG: hypothetical protein KDA61_19810, partial [Planctomycetales bacterium]|nr:hypothetical protein [Planctomycetales bacterium]